MAITVVTDLQSAPALTTISCEEREGAVVAMHRQCLVEGVINTDYQGLFAALDAASVPAFNSIPTGETNLVLNRREARAVGGATSKYLIDLYYVAKSESEYNFVFSGSSSLNQITTELDGLGQQVTVSHTFPAGDKDFPSTLRTQGASMSVLSPQMSLSAVGVMEEDYPHIIAFQWSGAVNATTWADMLPGTLICMGAGFVPHDLGADPKKYKFTFDFQFDPSGWEPLAVYIDERTGKPPENLVNGTGYKTVVYRPQQEYNTLFAL